MYDVVQENSTIEWKFEMFNLCRECVNKTVLPPPLSIVETIWKLFKAAVNRGHKSMRSLVFLGDFGQKNLLVARTLEIPEINMRLHKT